MTTTLQRTGAAVLALVLLAFALSILSVGAARADSAASLTPAAGTAGRGGVAFAAAVTPLAGTSGRGGVAALPPAALAGTQGRGGVALVPSSAAAGTAGAAAASLGGRAAFIGRGRVPAPVASAPANGGWIAGGLAVAALLAGLIALWAFSRRDRSAQIASVTSIGRESVASSDGVSQEWERKAA